MKSVDQRALLPFAGVIAVFIISRVSYDFAGIRFQGETYLTYWQFIDPVLLRTDLWRSVLYLHSQPPLMNLFTGIILQLFPKDNTQIFHVLYFIVGLALCLAIYWLFLAVQFPRWLAALLAIGWVVSPPSILYEHWLTYVLPLTAALTLAALALYQFVRSRKLGWGIFFFFLLASLALTWGLFHILWLSGLAILLLVILPNRKQVMLAALIPLLLVTAWYAKNLYLVSEFSANSWAGMNLSRISTFCLKQKERRTLVRDGDLSKFALVFPFRNRAAYLKLLPNTPVTGIPILDQPDTSLDKRNQHHLVYAESSSYYLRDALRVIRLRPDVYTRCMRQAAYIFFHSASDFDLIEPNRIKMRELELWWNRLFYSQWQSDETSAGRMVNLSAEYVGWWIVAAFLGSVCGGFAFLWKNRRQLHEPMNLLILFMLINIAFVSAVGILMDIGENNRFRFVIDPFILLLFTFVMRLGIGKLVPKKSKVANPAGENLSVEA